VELARHIKLDKAGRVLKVKNTTKVHMDVNYASVTAPELVYVEVKIGEEVIDGVWVAPGSSHSWWTAAGGKLLDHNGLDPGQTLEITSTGPCAFRIDWT
jgi:P pilus assembly chaperone PapD